MKPGINCITLAVDDIQKAFAFYRDGLGLSTEGVGDINEETDHIAFKLPSGLYLVLILRKDFTEFTQIANQSDAARGASECILSYFAAGKEEVDSVLKSVKAAGGTVAGEPKDQPWGYAALFTDMDGHLWEVMWNPRVS